MAMPLAVPMPTYTTREVRAFPDDGCRYEVDLVEKCVLVAKQGVPRDVRRAERLSWHPAEMPEPLAIDMAGLFRGVR